MASGNTVVSFTLRAIDRASSAIRRIGSAVAGVAKGLLSQGANIQGWVSLFQGAAGRIQGVFSALWGTIRESFKFETLTGQFRTLLGSTEAAEERMAMLARVAEETPFDLEGVAKANRTLSVMSGDALGTREALLLVGDTAAATGGQVEELAFWVGRAYAMIKGGQPFGEAAMRLSELGAITPEVRQKMEALQAAGAGSLEVWQVLQEHLETFSGAMAHLSQTGDGLTATLGDTWSASVRQFGDAFQSAAKDGIEFLINLLKKLQADGTIQKWAEAAVQALTPVKNLIQAVLGGDEETRGSALKAAWDYLKSVFEYGANVIRAAGAEVARCVLSTIPAIINVIGDVLGGTWLTSKITGVSMEDVRKDTIAAFTDQIGGGSFAEDLEAAGKGLKEASKAFAASMKKLAKKAEDNVEAATQESTATPSGNGWEKVEEDLGGNGQNNEQRAKKVQADIAKLLKEVEKRNRELAAQEAHWFERVKDSDKEERFKARREARENDKVFGDRARNLRRFERLRRRFATIRDPNAIFGKAFEEKGAGWKRLTHSERALLEWMRAQQRVQAFAKKAPTTEDLLTDNLEVLEGIRDDLKRLLTQA